MSGRGRNAHDRALASCRLVAQISLVAALAGLAACERAPDELALSKPPAKQAEAVAKSELASRSDVHSQPDPSAPAAKPEPAPRVRVVRRSGDVTVREDLAFATSYITGSDGNVALDLDNGARIDIEANSRVLVSTEAAPFVVLADGSLHVLLAPLGSAQRDPLRLATETSSLRVTRAVELWMQHRAAAGGGKPSTFVAVLAADAEVETLRGPSNETPRVLVRQRVMAGQAVASHEAERIAVTRGPHTLEAARKALATRKSKASRSAGAGEPAAAVSAALRAAVASFDAFKAQGTALLELQRTAAEQGNQARVRELQRELVAHAQQVVGMRAALQRSYEGALASAWSGCESAPCAVAASTAIHDAVAPVLMPQ
jgi:hypothetical protein